MYNLSAVVEKEEKWFVSHCVELGVASQGKTIEGALKNLREACALYLKHADPDEKRRLKQKKPSPIMTTLAL
ncbi:MAG: type II toxin-antitoxin system HicB family antitoxin [Candidatus Diapherotrites archaeon]|nr:type II toxin-antitoxin system HicB family antitoxin [Candidatus Diapherotrites archaeon]